MKKVRIAIIAVVCVGLIVGYFYHLSNKNAQRTEETVELTEVQQITTKDLEKNYPATPREVVKMYNRIITCFYNEQYTEDELQQLGDQARRLFDQELLENNPRDVYFTSLKADIQAYKDAKKTITSSAVSSTNDVEYKTVDGDECAYVQTSYFIKEASGFTRTYQMYVLRKDDDGNWKILVFYQNEGESSEDE